VSTSPGLNPHRPPLFRLVVTSLQICFDLMVLMILSVAASREGLGLGERGAQWTEVISWEPRAFVYHNFLVTNAFLMTVSASLLLAIHHAMQWQYFLWFDDEHA
jgi:hypothetical protein